MTRAEWQIKGKEVIAGIVGDIDAMVYLIRQVDQIPVLELDKDEAYRVKAWKEYLVGTLKSLANANTDCTIMHLIDQKDREADGLYRGETTDA